MIINDRIKINEAFKSGDKVTIYASMDHKWLPDYEIVREATSSDFSKYSSNHLKDYKGKKYLVKCNRNGLFKDTYSIELEKNIKLSESINESVSIPKGFREFTKTDYYGYAGAEDTREGTKPLIKSSKFKLHNGSTVEYDIIIAGQDRGKKNILDIYMDTGWDDNYYYPIDYPIDSLGKLADKVENNLKNLSDWDDIPRIMKKLGFKSY